MAKGPDCSVNPTVLGYPGEISPVTPTRWGLRVGAGGSRRFSQTDRRSRVTLTPMAYRRAEQRKAARRDSGSGSRPPTRSRSGPAPEGGTRQAWTRVARSRADAVADRLSAPIAGAFAAGWSAILTLLMVGSVVAVAWVLGAGSGSITDAMNVSGISWFATHLISISVPDGSISALPMGFVLIPGWLLWRAGSWAARRSGACLWQDIRPLVGIGAGVYATIALLVATATANEAASVSPAAAIIGAGLFAVVVFGGGATREAGLWPSIVDRFSPHVRLRLRAGLVSFGVIVAGAGVTLAVSLALHFSTGLTILETLSPGLIGNILLFLLGIAYLPNALIWASSLWSARDLPPVRTRSFRRSSSTPAQSRPSVARRYS